LEEWRQSTEQGAVDELGEEAFEQLETEDDEEEEEDEEWA
jgi:hypothetical protein